MYRVSKQFEFPAAHVLSKHKGRCRFPHGHNYKVEITLTAADLDENNMVCDFHAIKAMLKSYLGSLDHSIMLNSTDHVNRKSQENNPRCVLFEGRDPTSEVLAETIFRHLEAALRGPTVITVDEVEYKINPNVRLEKIRVRESDTAWAEFQL
jgi:6-pyruvoyltetrahydropterin/6-carboxytetrahydropterin synthase